MKVTISSPIDTYGSASLIAFLSQAKPTGPDILISLTFPTALVDYTDILIAVK